MAIGKDIELIDSLNTGALLLANANKFHGVNQHETEVYTVAKVYKAEVDKSKLNDFPFF